MATRSRIAVELGDGTVKSVYCHNDGYLDGVGRDLMYRFPNGTDSARVESFVNEGDRSTCGLSYKEWRNENCPADNVKSADDFFSGDIEEYGYLYNTKGEWVVKASYGNKGINNLIDLIEL